MVYSMVLRMNGYGFKFQWVQYPCGPTSGDDKLHQFFWSPLSDCFIFVITASVGQPSKGISPPPPQGGGWKWVGGLKGGFVGGSLPALEGPNSPPPPTGSLSNSLPAAFLTSRQYTRDASPFGPKLTGYQA